MFAGGHLNPAVTLAMAAIGKLPASAIPHYLLGQFAGGFLSAALTYLVYYGTSDSRRPSRRPQDPVVDRPSSALQIS